MSRLLALVLFFPAFVSGQTNFHLEGRFCGTEKNRSLIAEVQAPFAGIWTRFVNYPSVMMNSPEFPESSGSLGYSVLGEIGVPLCKVVFGNVDGEWVKGVHFAGESESGRVRSHLLLYHRPPLAMDAFRLDGELSLELFGKPFHGGQTSRDPRWMMGTMIRIECYEPAPIAFHGGLALKRAKPGKQETRPGKKPGGDFIENLDPFFVQSFRARTYVSDWSLFAGPTLYLGNTYGVNASLRYLF